MGDLRLVARGDDGGRIRFRCEGDQYFRPSDDELKEASTRRPSDTLAPGKRRNRRSGIQ